MKVSSLLWVTERVRGRDKAGLFGKDPDAGKIENRRRREDEMVGWHHQFNGHELGQTPEDGEEHGTLACCNPCGHKKLYTKWSSLTPGLPTSSPTGLGSEDHFFFFFFWRSLQPF